MNKLTWSITGGLGFLGSNLVNHLLEQGVNPKNISIINHKKNSTSNTHADVESSRGYLSIHESEIEIEYVDILDLQALAVSLDKADIIIHLAAATSVSGSLENPENDFRTNSIGTFNVLQCARLKLRQRVLFASSVSGFSASEIVTETTLPDPLSPYGVSKLHGEYLCKAWSGSYGLPVSVLRLTNAYGPRFDSNFGVIPQAIRAAISGNDFVLYGNGEASRDFVFTSDISDAFFKAATTEKIEQFELYQIASGSEVRINELLAIINSQLIKRGYRALSVVRHKARPGEIEASCGSSLKAKSNLGWSPQTNLEDGIGQTIDWYLNQRRDLT